jgi:thymidylate synthase ThyX
MISAKIIADSINPDGVRITTFVLTYPRLIHSEFLTHRMISRNASSSRAIPVKKQIQMVLDDPVIPLAFTKNQKGMQGGEALDGLALEQAYNAWIDARDAAVMQAQVLVNLEVHKQYANRLLEPFSHITVVATATDWDNFFALRCHPMAQPEIHALADEMYAVREASKPQLLKYGRWHLPFIDESARQEITDLFDITCLQEEAEAITIAIKCSVARCARVSYLNHDGIKTSIDDDLKLYDRLLGGIPKHSSPAEHQAQSTAASYYTSNFKSWAQYRKMLQDENITKFTPGMFDGPK